MLQGIVCAVKMSTQKEQLLFRYPPIVRASVTNETLKDRAPLLHEEVNDYTQNELFQFSSRLNEHNKEGKSNQLENEFIIGETKISEIKISTKEPYRLPGSIIASILLPKQQQLNSILEIDIDGTIFIGFPTSEMETAECAKRTLHHFIPLISTPKMPSVLKVGVNHPPKLSPFQFNFSNEKEISPHIDNNEKSNPTPASKQDELIAFTIAFSISSQANESIIEEYKELAKLITNSFIHANRQSNYIVNEVERILQIREKWIQDHIHYRQFISSKNSSSNTPSKQAAPLSSTHVPFQRTSSPSEKVLSPPTHAQLSQDILTVSTFANELKTIFHSIVSNGFVNLTINNWVVFSYMLNKSQKLYNTEKPFSFRPYHAIILKNDIFLTNHHNRKTFRVPIDVSSQLKRLMERAQPTKSFQELQVELGTPIEQLYRVASNLLYWGKAKLIDKMTMKSIFMINPHFEFYQGLSLQFSKANPSFNLNEELVKFSKPKTLEEHLPFSYQNEYINMVTWLLRNNVIIEIHQFIYFLPPPPNVILHNDDTAEYKLFQRLIPYFNGRNSVQEIMWRENINRKELEDVLQKFSSFLNICLHEPHYSVIHESMIDM